MAPGSRFPAAYNNGSPAPWFPVAYNKPLAPRSPKNKKL